METGSSSCISGKTSTESQVQGQPQEKRAEQSSEEATLDDEATLKSAKGVNCGRMTLEEFETILKERKAESKRLATEKRLEGLRIIQERNSKTGVDPLERFPKEIWILILDELTPSDKANLCHIHSLFHDLMESNRIRDIIFPLILDHKIGFIKKYFWCSESMSHSNLGQLRRVSKAIRNAIDKWCEDDLLAPISPATVTAWMQRYCPRDPVSIEMSFNEPDLEKILELRSPVKLFKRDLIVCDTMTDNAERDMQLLTMEDEEILYYFNLFVNNVTKALEQVGDQIWRFHFYCCTLERFGISRKQACSLLKLWLHHLPNLKMFKICFYVPPLHSDNELEPTLDIENSILWNKEFPTLPALKRIDLFATHGEYQSLKPIAESIISANPQIEMLTFDGSFDSEFMSQPCMRSLNLESCHFGNITRPILIEGIETILLNSDWNLSELHVYFNSACMNSLIRLLNRLPSLKSVYINSRSIAFSDDEIDFLRLPNLVDFAIEFQMVEEMEKYREKIQFLFSLQFLIHSSNLRTITWIYSSKMRAIRQQIELVHSKAMLDFGGGFNNLNNSNLWDAFPKLEQILVKYNIWHAHSVIKIFRKSRGILPFPLTP